MSPTLTWRMAWWSMYKELQQKAKLQYTTYTVVTSLVQWFMYKTNMINLWVFPFKCFVKNRLRIIHLAGDARIYD